MQTHSFWQRVMLLIIVALLIWLPRTLSLDHFATPDEPKWLMRSANFYYALTHGDFATTLQTEHPGVTIMWAGTAGYLWAYPEYAQQTSGPFKSSADDLAPFIRAQGRQPREVLAAGRFFVVLAIVSVLVAAFGVATRLIGRWAALLGFGLIAFDPFHIGLSRVLHLDGLLSSLMLLSLLLFLHYLYCGRGAPPPNPPLRIRRTQAGGGEGGARGALYLSAVAAGLAWLTKSPGLFLAPWMGLLLLLESGSDWRAWYKSFFPRIVVPFTVWLVIAIAIFVLLWPAMWVDPDGSLGLIFSGSKTYAVRGHTHGIYFNGEIIKGDPGFAFYPLVYLWRTTPVVLLGLLLAVLAFIRQQPPLANRTARRTMAILLLWALAFPLFMSFGAQKFDRYLLPIFAPLDLVAGVGWVAAAQWVRTHISRRAAPVLIPLALVIQLSLAWPTFPYYLTYFNPLLGGRPRAPEVMMIGWGEGLDEAARYLNSKPNAEQLRVSSWYHDGPFSYFFNGKALSINWTREGSLENVLEWLSTDYVVLYANQWQRQEPTPLMMAYLEPLSPEKVINVQGLEYARIYDIRSLAPPPYVATPFELVEWGGAIRFVGYTFPNDAHSLLELGGFAQEGAEEESGLTARLTFYLENIAPLDKNLNVLLRLVGRDGNEVWRDDGWPFGSPTSAWALGEIWPDGHALTLPKETPAGYYRLELSLYDPNTFDSWPISDAWTGEPLGDTLVVDYLLVGERPDIPADAPSYDLDSLIRLRSSEVTETLSPSEPLHVRLFWQAETRLERDLTVFVHLVGPDGQLVSQQDQEPLGGFFPTSLWPAGQVIADEYELLLPADAPAGTYELRVGMYDLVTGQRLPISQNGLVIGDYVTVATIPIELAP
ncbi:MAG: phospholipid carrier-dependent glycosyltransferase [Ardenticatenaceae bacterium]